MAQGLFPEPVLKKRRLTMQLATEIKKLSDDIVELENWSKSLSYNVDDTELDMGKLMSILCEDPNRATPEKPGPYDMSISSLISTLLPFSTKCSPVTSEEHPPPNPFALDTLSQAEPYLTLFAPLKLKSYSNTYCGLDPDKHLEKHTLELSTPRPFPSRHLHLAINYETDPETQSVLSISVPMGIDNKVPISLRQWIESRLANPLLKLDVSGLCWGIQRYWEASISRAKLWSRLEGQYRGLIRSRGTTSDTDKLDDFLDPDVPTLSSINPRKILPHLERTSMLFESGGGESLRAYFSCELAIDEWAGEPRLVPGISVSAPSMMNGRSGSKVEQDVKRLFHTILNEKQSGRIGTDVDINADAIVHAAEHILGVLFFDEPEKHAFKVKAKK
ncbi:hypothetical protein BDV32DRAFT_139300 [Aspergillus pseudonomiae]|uniref:Uncharacterized protein n=1 Tax=Aspergillus pseudonomiae TaxID=1506151 RepID=A0A5N6HWV7_9EURO|nr:uncharacterized protein BDV37DRAFT_272008 [Aspergillus pseudonomiae]KAB8258886.1 hypothetical protein BDV32DRAFT_139300 [Aspergillus pseudonomiae]KAE8403575.1 hypothetical protein BDV37DRAFT_272008 [Aspergillus pseudonomiae]